MEWPEWEVRAYLEFFSREPPVAERTEKLIAQLASFYMNCHLKEGVQRITEDSLRPHREAWGQAREMAEKRAALSENEQSFLGWKAA